MSIQGLEPRLVCSLATLVEAIYSVACCIIRRHLHSTANSISEKTRNFQNLL